MGEEAEDRQRVLFITDAWPMSSTPGEAPWAAIPALLLRERGHGVMVALLRRFFPPERVVKAMPRPRRLVAELEDWASSLRAKPSYDEVVRCYWYTSPPRRSHHHRWGSWAHLFAGRRLRQSAAAFGPTVVHGHFAVPGGTVAQQLANELGLPYVVSVHGADLAYTATLSTKAAEAVGAVLAGADAIIANSWLTQAEIQRRWGIPDAVVLWQGGDVNARFERTVGDPVRILSVGHLYGDKGYRETATVLAAARSRGARFCWTIIGRGTVEDRGHLQSILEAAGLTASTTVIPGLPNEEVRKKMAEADVFLLLSQRDAYGVVYAEALGAGLAVVGSRSAGAMHDFARSGAPVVPVQPVPSEETIALVSELLLDRAALAKRKQSASEWASRHLGWSRYVAELEGVYGTVTESHASRAVQHPVCRRPASRVRLR